MQWVRATLASVRAGVKQLSGKKGTVKDFDSVVEAAVPAEFAIKVPAPDRRATAGAALALPNAVADGEEPAEYLVLIPTGSTLEPMETDGCDDDMDITWSADSLAMSDDSEEEQEPLDPTAKPPLAPGLPMWILARTEPLEGTWRMCNPSGKFVPELHSLTIRGGVVVDGTGIPRHIRGWGTGNARIFGGRLNRKGAALVRRGVSGNVQVYLRE